MDQYRRFDEAYYHRFYENPKTRIYGPKEHSHLAQYVFSFARWNEIEVGSVLDIGAGVGLWKHWIEKNAKEVEYTGIEVSQTMCKKHDYQHRDIARWRDRRKYDLIICQGVLQYLPDRECAAAIENLARLSRRFMYLEVLTTADAEQVCCPEGTDFEVHVRDASWYAKRLKTHFVNLGGGLYAKPVMRDHYFELWCTAA
jgi:SAM-dependent methyltransferase